MIYTLENENIKITVSKQGAELHNITSKIDCTEYLWNGNKKYWGYHAPVLFPIVNFMAAITILSDFGAQKNKVSHCFHCFPIYFP